MEKAVRSSGVRSLVVRSSSEGSSQFDTAQQSTVRQERHHISKQSQSHRDGILLPVPSGRHLTTSPIGTASYHQSHRDGILLPVPSGRHLTTSPIGTASYHQSHRDDILLRILLKLLQKSHIILEKHPKIVDLITEHCDALDTHSKSKSRIFFRIDTTSQKNCRVYHTATHDL